MIAGRPLPSGRCLDVRQWPDPVLSVRAAPVADAGLMRELAADMLATMYHAEGRGLAAPQVGVSCRLFVMDATWKQGSATPQIFINPEIVWKSDQYLSGAEGCLSIPGITVDVARATSILLRWTDLDGSPCQSEFSGFESICAQHEIDHLDGIVTLDHLSPDARAIAEAEYLK